MNALGLSICVVNVCLCVRCDAMRNPTQMAAVREPMSRSGRQDNELSTICIFLLLWQMGRCVCAYLFGWKTNVFGIELRREKYKRLYSVHCSNRIQNTFYGLRMCIDERPTENIRKRYEWWQQWALSSEHTQHTLPFNRLNRTPKTKYEDRHAVEFTQYFFLLVKSR